MTRPTTGQATALRPTLAGDLAGGTTAAMLALVAQDAPSRTILCAGAGSVEAAHITLTQGAWIGLDANAPERLVEQMDQVRNRDGEMVPQSGAAQGTQEVGRATRQLAGS